VRVERLWTPWRRAFVEGAAADGTDAACFLCGLAADLQEDQHNLVLARADRVFVLMNLYPYNSGHLMVAPYQHCGDLAMLDPSTSSEMMHLTQRCVSVLQAVYRPHGFNIGMNLGKPAGAGVPDHLHIHVVPRWNGDTNFMPVVGQTKVLPELLRETSARLAPRLAGESQP
jgi:ATP adenylyltransferase